MARLIYSALASLDGYVADESGRFDWAMPDEAVHVFLNDRERSVGLYLYGRRMYEVMAVWETIDSGVEQPAYIRDYAAIWRAADKVVYSRTMESVRTDRTRIEKEFDPEAVRLLKANAKSDITIGGPTLAAEAIEAGLVDEYQVIIAPVAVGGGLRFLPEHVRLDLALLEERRFGNGMVFLRYEAGRTIPGRHSEG